MIWFVFQEWYYVGFVDVFVVGGIDDDVFVCQDVDDGNVYWNLYYFV